MRKQLAANRREGIPFETDSFIDDILRRDEDRFRELFHMYAKLLWTVAGGVLSDCAGGEQDVEECVSDAFIELWNHPEKYDRTRGSLKSYLCRIAKNKAIDIWRRKNKENVVSLQDFIETQPGEDRADLIDIGDYRELYKAIGKLQEPTREIVVRRYFHDEKPRQIAKRLGLPEKEVENRLYRGKKKLMESLGGEGEAR